MVEDTNLGARGSAVIRAGDILMDVGTPCTDRVCPYCKSSTGRKDQRMEEIWTCRVLVRAVVL